MNQSAERQVYQAIQNIIQKGGEALYQEYLNEKLPADCNQTIMNNILAKFNPMVYIQPSKNFILKQRMPQPASVDKIMPNKIVIRSKSELNIRSKAEGNFFNTQIPTSNEKSHRRQNIKSAKPNFCIKYDCRKGQVDKVSDKIRKQKIQSEREDVRNQQQSKRTEQKEKNRRSALQRKIKQLLQQGVPYTYDSDGNLQIPDIKQFKKNIEKQYQTNKNKNKNTFTLRIKALQLLGGGSQINTEQNKVQTKKKGFYSMKNDNVSKRRVNQQQFSNKNQRQSSSIPFMDVQDGVKIVQREKNIMAHRIRVNSSHKTRNEYLSESRNTFFKSFLPTSQYSSVRASSAQRPATSFSTHRKHEFPVNVASAINLGVRPKTGRQRITVFSKQQAVKLVKE